MYTLWINSSISRNLCCGYYFFFIFIVDTIADVPIPCFPLPFSPLSLPSGNQHQYEDSQRLPLNENSKLLPFVLKMGKNISMITYLCGISLMYIRNDAAYLWGGLLSCGGQGQEGAFCTGNPILYHSKILI